MDFKGVCGTQMLRLLHSACCSLDEVQFYVSAKADALDQPKRTSMQAPPGAGRPACRQWSMGAHLKARRNFGTKVAIHMKCNLYKK